MHQHPAFAASRVGLKLHLLLAIQQNWIQRMTFTLLSKNLLQILMELIKVRSSAYLALNRIVTNTESAAIWPNPSSLGSLSLFDHHCSCSCQLDWIGLDSIDLLPSLTMHNSESGSSPHGSGFGSDRSPRVVKVLPISHNNATMFSSSSDLSRKNMSWMPWLERAVPSLKWMKEYNWRDSLKADAIAGITVGTMLIPQVSQLLILTSFASISTDNFDHCGALRRLRFQGLGVDEKQKF